MITTKPDTFIAPPCLNEIDILFQDEHLLLINKPDGLLSLSGKNPLNKDSVHFRLVQHFRHWLLRWLYVFGGLAGCVCIATGFIFFVEKRKRQHAKEASQGARVVDALAVTTVTGMLIASLGILIANRLLPDTLSAGYWPVAGVDLFLVTGAVIAALSAHWLKRRNRSEAVAQQNTEETAHA